MTRKTDWALIRAALLCFLIPLGACTPPLDRDYALDGARGPGFAEDLTACKARALQETPRYGEGAAAGALGGALAGAIDNSDDRTEGAVGGAAAGALVGMATAGIEFGEVRREMVIRCMAGRGHRVIG